MSKFNVSIEVIREQRNSGEAFSLACNCSSLEAKEIFMPLNIDKGTFSRMKRAEATLPADSVQKFCHLVGNNIYLEWLAYQVGCTLVMIETEAERRLKIAEARAEAAEGDVATLKSLLKKS